MGRGSSLIGPTLAVARGMHGVRVAPPTRTGVGRGPGQGMYGTQHFDGRCLPPVYTEQGLAGELVG